MMIVVQSLARREKREPLKVAGTVRVGAPTEVMSDCVHSRRATHVEVGVDESRRQTSPRAEDDNEDRCSENESEKHFVIDEPVPSVRREVAGILEHRVLIAGFGPVQSHVGPLHLPPTEQYGGVRITFDVGESMVFPVHGDPLTWFDPRGQPDDQAESVTYRSLECQSPVRERAVKVDRGGNVGQGRGSETDDHPDEYRSHGRTVTRRSEGMRSHGHTRDRNSLRPRGNNRCRRHLRGGEHVVQREGNVSRAADFEELPLPSREKWMTFGRWSRPYFPSLVGVTMVDVRADYCCMRLGYRPELEQPMGIVHGGAIATLIDVVVVPAIGSAYPVDIGFSTIDMHIQYLAALREESALAEGWVIKRGRRIVFCQAEVLAEESRKIIARGSLTYSVSGG